MLEVIGRDGESNNCVFKLIGAVFLLFNDICQSDECLLLICYGLFKNRYFLVLFFETLFECRYTIFKVLRYVGSSHCGGWYTCGS